jgi:SAM-dependent methyltransferase
VGADLPGNPDASIDLNPDGTLPIEDRTFDAVLSTQVLEHVEDPDLYLRECFRVLRPGGRMLLSTHGTFIYHPDPDDYWRWTCAGLQRAVRRVGFEIVRFEGIIGLAATGLQLVLDAIYSRLRSRHLRNVVAFVFNGLMWLADRFESEPSRRLNACVFALVVARP